MWEWRRKWMGRERLRREREGAAARAVAAARRIGSGTSGIRGRDGARRAGRCGREGCRYQFGAERAAERCARSAAGVAEEVGRGWEAAMRGVCAEMKEKDAVAAAAAVQPATTHGAVAIIGTSSHS